MTDAERMADFHRRIDDLNELDRLEIAGCALLSTCTTDDLTEEKQGRLADLADATILKAQGIAGLNFQILLAAEIVLRLHRWAKGCTSAKRMLEEVEPNG